MRTQVYMRMALVVGAAVILSGCWTPPSASVRPEGKPRLVGQGIEVDWVVDSAKVESVNRAARTVALSVRGVPLPVYKIGPSVSNWGDVHTAEHVRATIQEVLTVYVAAANERNGPNAAARSRSPDARVLVVDPSYRLLTVQYRYGGTETFKIALHTRMSDIEAGDSVAIRQVEVTGLRVQRHWKKESSRPRRRVTSGR